MFSENKYFLNDKYIFDANTKSLSKQSDSSDIVWLGNNESNIILAFIERPNQVLSRDQIHEIVWKRNGFYVDESSVIQAISTVRKILKDSVKNPEFIKTIPKHGYQFIAKCKRVDEEKNDNFNEDLSSQENVITSSNQFNIKKLINKNYLLYFFAFISMAFAVNYIWFSDAKPSPKYTSTYEVDKLGRVGIYMLTDNHKDYEYNEDLKYCIGNALKYHNIQGSADKVIASYTLRNELTINVLDKVLTKSSSYILLARNVDLKKFCEMRFYSVKK